MTLDEGLRENNHPSDPPGTRNWNRRSTLKVFALFLVVSLTMTWPLVLHLTDHTSSDWGDARLTIWILSWDAHALSTDPTDLFQSPAFYPERDALAYTEHLITLGVLTAPIIWATGNPYLAQNLLFLVGMCLAGFGVYLLARELLQNPHAAIIAGVAYLCAPYWFGRVIALSHVQIIASAWLPFAVLGIVRWVRTGGIRHLGVACGSLFLGTLASWYMGALVVVAIAVTFLALILHGQRGRLALLLGQGALAALIVVAAVAPFTLPYRRVEQRDPQAARSLQEIEFFSAHLSSYLSAPVDNRVYGAATETFRARQRSLETTLFPGMGIVILSGTGLAVSRRRRDTRSALYLGVGLVALGILLSLGAGTSGIRRYLPWVWLEKFLPLFQALGVPARFHVLTVLGLAILSGLGMQAFLSGRLSKYQGTTAIVVLILVLEATSIPLRLGHAPKTPPVYRTLSSRPGAVLELPTIWTGPTPPGGNRIIDDYDYLIYQIGHWYPLVNGIGAHFPFGYPGRHAVIKALPSRTALAILRREGIRTLIVHQDRLPGTPWEELPDALIDVAGVTLLKRAGPVLIYDLAPLS